MKRRGAKNAKAKKLVLLKTVAAKTADSFDLTFSLNQSNHSAEFRDK